MLTVSSSIYLWLTKWTSSNVISISSWLHRLPCAACGGGIGWFVLEVAAASEEGGGAEIGGCWDEEEGAGPPDEAPAEATASGG